MGGYKIIQIFFQDTVDQIFYLRRSGTSTIGIIEFKWKKTSDQLEKIKKGMKIQGKEVEHKLEQILSNTRTKIFFRRLNKKDNRNRMFRVRNRVEVQVLRKNQLLRLVMKNTFYRLLTDQELKENLEDKHINLFKEEEEQINREEISKALMQKESEFFKDKPFDSTSRFLGTLANEENKPWYMKSKQKSQQEVEKQLQLKNQITNFKEYGEKNSFYKVLQIKQHEREKKGYERVLEEQTRRRTETKHEKKDRKEQKRQEKIQKLAKQLKKLIDESSDEEDRSNKQIRQKLEEERKQRERHERERQQRLLKQVYEFDFQKKEEI